MTGMTGALPRVTPALTLAVLSLKGGTGKTTTVLGLAGAAAARGLRVLVVDIDPQANATDGLGVTDPDFTTNDVIADARPGVAADAVAPSPWPGVEVIPAERALEHRGPHEGPDSAQRLRVALTGVPQRYDVVLIDCPPSLGELTRNALAAAEGALVVTEPSYFALTGAAAALDAVDVVRARPTCAGAVRHRRDRFRAATAASTASATRGHPPVPERTAVQQAQGAGVAVQAWRSDGGREVSAVLDTLLLALLERHRDRHPARPALRAVGEEDR
jgi:cellulose biosynthesis protein BcsQ